MICGLMLGASPNAGAWQSAADAWIGKRVVQKVENVVLRTEDFHATSTGTEIPIYRVLRTKGPSVFLRAEDTGVSGWGQASQFVPVEHAIRFFTEQIHTRPNDFFSLVMRARIRLDTHELKHALADLDLAVSIRPNSHLAYLCRGIAPSRIIS